jgi:uncharacterized protein (UPF0333 family)
MAIKKGQIALAFFILNQVELISTSLAVNH